MMPLRFGLLALVVFLAACASSTGRRETVLPPPKPGPQVPVQPAPPALPPPVIAEPVPLEPQVPEPPSAPQTAEVISGQAVLSLMRQARESRSNGQFDLAASQLERAQRIEPRNYFVWSALAQVYLDQQQFDQAISVAGKSNSLARGNAYVEIENWRTIATARRAQGDSIGALQAESRIGELERLIGGG